MEDDVNDAMVKDVIASLKPQTKLYKKSEPLPTLSAIKFQNLFMEISKTCFTYHYKKCLSVTKVIVDLELVATWNFHQ